MARGEGIEPPLTGPKPAVLPLDDPRMSGDKIYLSSADADTGFI